MSETVAESPRECYLYIPLVGTLVLRLVSVCCTSWFACDIGRGGTFVDRLTLGLGNPSLLEADLN